MPEWSTCILGCSTCSDCGFCCLSTWCGCIAYGMNTALMEGHRGYSKCCYSACYCPESCECQYCGNACCLYAIFNTNGSSFRNGTFRSSNATELILGISCELLSSLLESILTGVLIYNQVKAVGKGKAFMSSIYHPYAAAVMRHAVCQFGVDHACSLGCIARY
jgi:hypothetical protein